MSVRQLGSFNQRRPVSLSERRGASRMPCHGTTAAGAAAKLSEPSLSLPLFRRP